MTLKVIVVGAGIAGLCAAIALRQAGHEVEIFEKSAFAAEIGAALVISPNGAKVLKKLGFSFTKAQAVRLGFWNVLHGENLQLLQSVDTSKADQQFGNYPWAIHRVDLHNELLRLATSESERGYPVTLRLSSEVIQATIDGTVVLRNGDTHAADLIVAADGLKSVLREEVTQIGSASSTGMSAFRLLVDTDKLIPNKKLHSLVQRLDGGGNLLADVKETVKERHMMWYSCRNGRVINVAGIHPTREDAGDNPEGEIAALRTLCIGTNRIEATKAIMLDEFKHFSPEVLDVVRRASNVKCWPLFSHEPLPRWHVGRIVLIGDSAHPMLPFGGQGANMAIEDGGSLGYIFNGITNVAEIETRLELFRRARYARASRVQILSSVRAGKEKDVELKLRQYSDPPGSKVPTNMMERTIHDFGFDVYKKCDQVLSEGLDQGHRSKLGVPMRGLDVATTGVSAGFVVAAAMAVGLLFFPASS